MDALVALEGSAPWCGRLRVRRPLPFRRAVVALFRADLVDGLGALVEQRLVAVRCARLDTLLTALGTGRRFRIPDSLMAALAAEAERDVGGRLEELQAGWPSRLAPLAERESALAAADDEPIAAFQPGLFDRRELRRIARERQIEALLADQARAQIEAVSSRGKLSLAGPPRVLLAALVECVCDRDEFQFPQSRGGGD